VKAAPARLSDSLAAAFASDDTSAQKRLAKELDQARARAAEPWQERVKGAQLKVKAAESEVAKYAQQNFAACIKELLPQVEAVQRGQVEALQALVRSESERNALVATVLTLEREAGRQPTARDQPLPLAREARRVLEAGPPPPIWPPAPQVELVQGPEPEDPLIAAFTRGEAA
jgi:hypothetical protein